MRFGSSGIRSLYGSELLSTALALGQVLGMRHRKVVMGWDTRTTSRTIANAFTAGVLSGGGTVHSAGLVPTPAVAGAVPEHGAGCMVTASHNPEEYNGLKVFNPGGSSLLKAQQEEMEGLLETESCGQTAPIPWDTYGSVLSAGILESYMQGILGEVHCECTRKMVLDCGNGAGSVASPGILKGLGMDTRCINCSPSGYFPRPSEPLEEYLGYLRTLVRRWEADGAVIHDGDADRMMAFDSRGRYISGDILLVLFSRYLGARRVVTTTDTSMAIEDWAEVRRTPVGDSHVSEELVQWGDLGGEPSGAWIFPWHSLCPDGPYAAALFCQMASEWDIAAEIDTIPHYPLLRRSIPCQRAHEVMKALGAPVPTDGIRVEEEDGWYLVRASGTEPKIRVTAEGRTPAAAEALLGKGLAAAREWKKEIKRQ
ncbi:MAG: phosphopentomutase/phosphoglucosamine mutase [Methanolinea sp.]|jgi:phosphoglucosamine mutase|nr:phosphopentomutase/phosphoglucosamine mutase [Methanolinea sp.]